MSTLSGGIDMDGVEDVSAREGQGRVVHITDPSGEPAFYGEGENQKPVTVKIAGSYSPKYRQILDHQTQRMLKRRQSTITREQLAENRAELVAGCILEWDGFLIKGEAFPLTKDNAMTLVKKAEWIRTQLEEAQNDHEGFSKNASAT